MIQNYFKIAFRSLLHNKSYAFINVTGLALGLAACIVIFLIVRNELGYDSYHEKAERTYRVTVHGLDYNPSVSFAIAPVFKNDFPEATVSQYYYQQSGLIKAGEQRYNKEAYAFADNQFSQIFDFEWLAGNPALALKEPNTVVLTETAARKFFGDDAALGKTIKLDNEYDLRVTGVIADLPSNTHLTFSFLVSWETIRKQAFSSNFWSIQGGYLYVALPDNNASGKRISSNFPSFIRKNWGDNIAKNTELILQPLREIHFDKRYLNQISMPRSKETIYGLAGVALFIILTACINFVNLATAQALRRAKEVGVRKTLGAFRKQLVLQMMGETTLLVAISVLLAITAVMLFVPFTQSLLNIRLEISALFEPQVLVVIFGITILTIFISGLYPALVQSRLQPLKALTSGVARGMAGNSGLRKVLVVVQFAITQIMIVGTLVVGNQMDFFLNQDLGYDKDAIVTFPTGAKRDVLYQQLLDHPGVQQVSFASGGPAYNNNFAPFLGIGSDMKEADVTEIKQVDEHYMPMYKMQLLAGKPIK
jgi:ABC-type antimicrobial peptide transport system permease subunit